MRPFPKLIQTVLSAAVLLSGAAHAYELRFQDGYAQNTQAIANDYGSVAGVIDVFIEASNGANLLFWAGDYSGNAAAYSQDSVGVITLRPLAGATVTLDSFFLGGWLNTDRGIRYIVDDLATADIDIEVDPAFVSGTTGLSVTPGVSSAQGIRITFGPDGFNGGINNIVFSVTAVPEPESWLMLLAGLGLMGHAARRNGRRPAAGV
jgi:hypothetical protein